MASNTTLCANNVSVQNLSPGKLNNRLIENLTVTDVDAQDNTLFSAAQVAGGMVVHTSQSSGGTVTSDTAANYISNLRLDNDGDTGRCYYINDGSEILTLAAGTGVTIGVATHTIAANESALILIRRTSPTAVTIDHIGA